MSACLESDEKVSIVFCLLTASRLENLLVAPTKTAVLEYSKNRDAQSVTPLVSSGNKNRLSPL